MLIAVERATSLRRSDRRAGKQVEAEGHHAHRHRQSRGARHLAGCQHGVAQRPIGDEFALRDQDHAGDGKHQHQLQARATP